MQTFTRRGFQLRTASFETRVAYTWFLVLVVLGLATLVALAARVGLTPGAIATYYRGDDTEMSFPKTFWQLVETSHFHLFTVPVVVLILSHLLYGTPTSARLRVRLTLVTFTGALLEAIGPWLVRYVAGAMAYALLLGWVLLVAGAVAILIVTLMSMWAPERWIGWFSAPPEGQ
ncbi:MAG TPA: hypothetical protein VLX92_20935 [Kofleriaceae bacterium]|nr:hypothetical protein [Kofleriaceae bacterium]